MLALINLSSLGAYPAPHCDETNHLAVSYNFFHEGRFVLHTMDDVGGFSQNFSSQGRLYQVAKGLLLELLGYTVTAGRAFSFLGWLLAIALTYLAGRSLYDERTGLAAAVALAASNNAFYASHVGREEIWIAAAAAGMLAATAALRRAPSRGRFAATGLLMVAAADIHPNALWFALPIGLLLVVENVRSAEGRIRLAWMAGAGLLSGALVAAAHLLPDPAAALAHLRFASQYNGLLNDSIGRRLAEQAALMWDTYVVGLNGSVAVLTTFALAGLAVALARRAAGDRLLLLCWGGSLLAFALLLGYKSAFYGRLWEPFLALAAGTGIVTAARWIAARRPRLRPDLAAGLLLAPLVVAGAGSQAWLGVKFHERDTQAYYDEIAALVPPGEPVMGDASLWPLFNGRNPFTADEVILRCEIAGTCRAITGEEIARLLDELGPEYVVADGTLGCDNQVTPASQAWLAALDATCTPVGSFDNRWFGAGGQTGQGGATQVYACNAPAGN